MFSWFERKPKEPEERVKITHGSLTETSVNYTKRCKIGAVETFKITYNKENDTWTFSVSDGLSYGTGEITLSRAGYYNLSKHLKQMDRENVAR